MTVPRTLAALLLATLLIAGCSDSDDSPAVPHATAPKPSPSSSPTSAFCLDLSTFQVGLVTYTADAGRAMEGQPLDFKELRRKATLILTWGEEMESTAPPGIAAHFRTVLKAIKDSSSHLKKGALVRDVVTPLYGKKNRPAFDAVNKYDCDPGTKN
ncbi:hypothetical protein [Actinomadura decatromicini]|uniref:Lipoprotein n=1 Tax=Actinomadura decatromicini TaxID=2604572 RepID=A0A5D3FIC0_9ACTN|nr:hypothetical protein [Actinomadura decatromicini]TYK47045.1 hypothetical protein FXF68_24875 [Actinomadura decatromicini]